MDSLDLLAVQGTLKSLLQHHNSKASILQRSDFFTVQLSHPYMTTGKTIALTRWTLLGKVMSLLLNMPTRLVMLGWMNHSTPGLPVHHQLLEFTQIHVHWVGDAIQPSHPLLFPSPPTPNPSQHQSLSNESTVPMRWPKYWSFSFSIIPSKEIPGLISFRTEWFDILAVQGTLKSLNTTVHKHKFFGAQPSSQTKSHIHTWPQEKPYPWLGRP